MAPAMFKREGERKPRSGLIAIQMPGAVSRLTSRSSTMLLKLGLRTAALATIVSCGLIGQAVLAGPAGAVTVAKAELQNGQLRLEGESSPGVFVTAESTTSGATPTPVQWKILAGSIPTGMFGPASQGTTAGNIIGTPSIPGTYQFTLQVTDQIGDTAQETLTVRVI